MNKLVLIIKFFFNYKVFNKENIYLIICYLYYILYYLFIYYIFSYLFQIFVYQSI